MNVTILPLDAAAMTAAREQQERLLKPRGALGRLEDLSIRLAGMTGRLDWLPERRAIIVFAADHGIAQQGVSTVPPAITAYMVGQFLRGQAAICVLARQMQARLTVVDAGVAYQISIPEHLQARWVSRPVAAGTRDFTVELAMSAQQAAAALQLGATIAQQEVDAGLDILIAGEMGIGNTTSASALIAALTHTPAAMTTGRGTGIDDDALARKIAVVERGLTLHTPAPGNALATLGGFEIGAMAGAMLTAASQRVPVVLDGVISAAAALVAMQINPAITDYLIAGHQSAEPGHLIALGALGLAPLLTLDMRLGEGTGAALALPIVEAAIRTLNEMGTLDVG